MVAPPLEVEEEDVLEASQPVKKLKTSNTGYKAPTADELYTLKNTENLYQSNLFRLQVNITKNKKISLKKELI